MKIYTFDCSECGKPIGYSYYATNQMERILCLDCIHRYRFVFELVGISHPDVCRVVNHRGETANDCRRKSLAWNKNVYSSVQEIEYDSVVEKGMEQACKNLSLLRREDVKKDC